MAQPWSISRDGLVATPASAGLRARLPVHGVPALVPVPPSQGDPSLR